MLIPHARDTVHRAWLLRLLSAIADDRDLTEHLRFKGGTCAALRGLLDRFSVDLDFDLLTKEGTPLVRRSLERIFSAIGLTIKDQSAVVPQYFVRYDSPKGHRNTIAVDITVPPSAANTYEVVRFPDIDRFIPCHTIPTMVAHKLVTPLDRFALHGSVAGRDIYDIHHFLFNGFPWNEAVIRERTGYSLAVFFRTLHDFIEKRVTQTIVDQDLNTLVTSEEFQRMRTRLKQETLSLIRAASE
ncbi:MAG: nucleotidyl transferase AbiEii/AbiGii toxin family protein [Candidatus Peribacteraceae bacterium]|nr:nucleotidyl transferase AbiEii/AbiGii toxin family protein [Candidatus Peribacteraceae bacterium]